MKNIIILFIVLIQYGCANDNYYYKNNQKINLTPLNKASRDMSKINYYENNQGVVLGITDKLMLKLKDRKFLDNTLSEFNLTLEKTLGNNLYLVRTADKSLTIDISNNLNKKEYIEYAHPDFKKKMIRR